MTLGLAWFAAIAGFALISLSSARHQKLFGLLKLLDNKSILLKWVGFLMLTVSLCLWVALHGIANGIVFWIGALTFSALAIASAITLKNNK